jgi:hypothetical protein
VSSRVLKSCVGIGIQPWPILGYTSFTDTAQRVQGESAARYCDKVVGVVKVGIASQMASAVQSIGISSERLCWLMLSDVSRLVSLSAIDSIVVRGVDPLAHVAMLARQLQAARFQTQLRRCVGDGHRMLWLTIDDTGDVEGVLQASANSAVKDIWDVLVVAHPADLTRAVNATINGYARIAARKHSGWAVSVFGRGLARDLFQDRNRSFAPIRLVASQSPPSTSEL